ncbi:unnamed protein product [Sphagnum balticum]
MAKEKRFPSPANVDVTKSGVPIAPKAKVELTKAEVVAKAQKLIQVHYSGENAVVLPNGVHSIATGLNHIGESVWTESKKHPTIAKLIKEGKIKAADADEEFQAPAKLPVEESDDSSESA